MSLSSDNFTALIHLRDQARKWKNITFITIIITLIILIKVISSSISGNNSVSNDDDYIAVIDIEGMIFDDKYRTKILKQVQEKDNIKAVIINISSPGGGIVGSEILYRNILDISKEKPVVCVMGSIATSGGYMAAIASDYIIAHNGTLTGSIGVIMQSAEVTQMADNLGIKLQNYKSSPLKGSPSPFEKSNIAVDKIINDSVLDSYKFFSQLVLDRRKDKLDKNKINEITDGRVFTGRQAFAVGLIDKIGTQDDALKYLEEKHEIKDLKTKDVSIKKINNKLLDKVLNTSIIENIFHANTSSKRLMAIW